MAPRSRTDALASVQELFVAIEDFVEDHKLDKRSKNLLRLSMPAHQAWIILGVCTKERMSKSRSSSSVIVSEVHKHGFRSDVNSRTRIMDIFKSSRGDLNRDDKSVIENASLMQIMNLLEDVTERYQLDERAFSVLKEKTPLDKTMQLLISVLTNRVLDRSKNPSSAIMGQLKMMPSKPFFEEMSPPRRSIRRVSRSRSPTNRRPFPREDRDNNNYDSRERSRRSPSPRQARERSHQISPHQQDVEKLPIHHFPVTEQKTVAVVSIDAALATVNGWAEHNRITSRTRHDLLHRIPYDAVLRGIAAYPTDAVLGEALIRSLEKDPSCQEMPSIESLSREAEDYVTAIGGTNSDILATIKDKLFIRDADSLVAGQLASLHQNSLPTAIPILHDRIWFVQTALTALANGQPLPAIRSIPQYTAPQPASSGARYLGGIIIGAPTNTHQSSYRR